MMIVGVVTNPDSQRGEEVVSMQEAVAAGILDLAQGLYYNSTTGQYVSMVDAMNKGYVKVSLLLWLLVPYLLVT